MAKTEFEVFAQKNSNVFSRRPVSGRIYEDTFKKIYLNPNGDTLLHDMDLGRCVVIFTERTTLPL